MRRASCLLLIQTAGVLSQPWALLALYAAARTGNLPIVCVHVENSGYDFEQARSHLGSHSGA